MFGTCIADAFCSFRVRTSDRGEVDVWDIAAAFDFRLARRALLR